MGGPLENFEDQRRACAKLGSPFTAALCRLIPEVMGQTAFARRIRNWPGDAGADALALRACGALHALVLNKSAPALAAVYPPSAAGTSALRTALAQSIADNDDLLTGFLDRPPQTNEVGRSSMILGAAMHVARETGLPLATLEIGASAGLNLWFSHYAFDLGDDLVWKGANAPLTVSSDWSGNLPPLDVPLRVVDQIGCDQDPLNPHDPDDRLRLLSYIWPDQPIRLERMRQALAYAATRPTLVENVDAADWVERQLTAPPSAGVARMLYHTLVWQYLPEPTKARIATALETAGAAATPQAPLAWFRFENDMAGHGGLMELTLWPGGATRNLGRADFHGRWVEWA